MKIIKYMLLPFALFLAGCVSISDVVPAGKDTWMISGTNTRIGADSTMKADLYKKASDFCASKNKVYIPVSQNYISHCSGSGFICNPGSADLFFRCLDEGDPELTRPIMEPVPDKSK
jgi:hypothetical protein